MSVPIGILTAIYLVEYAQPTATDARTVTFLVDVMTGIPSIVAGLFAFALFTLLVGPKAFSGFSASVALCVLMIPIVVRSSEEMLKLVLDRAARGVVRARRLQVATIIKIVLPTATRARDRRHARHRSRHRRDRPIFIAASFTDDLNPNPFSGPM